MAEKPRTLPTDRSIPPATMTSVIPRAMMASKMKPMTITSKLAMLKKLVTARDMPVKRIAMIAIRHAFWIPMVRISGRTAPRTFARVMDSSLAGASRPTPSRAA